jgi:uncharacterized protein
MKRVPRRLSYTRRRGFRDNWKSIMGHKYSEIAFTSRVKEIQENQGSRRSYAKFENGEDSNAILSDREREFIGARDSFYMATVGETGWPYLQHRGGPEGFVSVLDCKTLGFADFRGNRQYVSVGNLTDDNRVSFFFMDYANQARLKIFGRTEVTDDPKILEQLTPLADYRARVERVMLIHVEAFDWNCPQHITRRFTETEVREAIAPLQAQITELEAAQ